MGLDIVEIALDYLTDFVEFEKIASEIMRDEGYTNIKPLGGVADKGRDAVCESFHISGGKSITVFQYTLEENMPGKINDTIKKLNDHNIEFNELVLVMPHQITTQRQDQMKRDVRREYGINLNIFERKTLVNRLANYENGIFHRHFPDIEKQIQELKSKQPILTSSEAEALETAMIRSSLAFSLNKESPRVRSTIFDSLTLSVISTSTENEIPVSDFYQKFKESVGIELPMSQVEASLRRLVSRGMVNWQGELIILTKFAKQSLSGVIIKSNEATKSLIIDVINEISSISKEKLSAHDEETITQNTRNVLIKLFRLFGMELVNQVLGEATPSPVYLEASEDLLNTARDNLHPQIGELLIYILSEILRNPTEEQADILADWSLAYLGVQIMNLDPNLRELQSMRFASKMFILDTDFILDCIVTECPQSGVYLGLINSLSKLGCRIIIPKSCINECAMHAKISPNTYHFFGDKLLSFNEAFITERVWNVFVKGYYYAITNHLIPSQINYDRYLSNYYEPSAEVTYLTQIIQNRFPEGVEIIDISELVNGDIPQEQMNAMSAVLREMHSSGKKAEYRSEEEVEHLAETDARLFLTSLYLNKGSDTKQNEILGGCCYLITSSAKYIRSSKKIGLRDVVTARPQSLIAILELIGSIDVSPTEFVKLFENPFLVYAVEQIWEDVYMLLDSGIDLKDKSLTRLRWDLDQELHGKLSALIDSEEYAETAKEEAPIGTGDKEYTELIKTASKRGYRQIPELEAFMKTLEEAESKVEVKEQQYNELLEVYQNLQEEITHFSRRKQRYLRRMAAKGRRKK